MTRLSASSTKLRYDNQDKDVNPSISVSKMINSRLRNSNRFFLVNVTKSSESKFYTVNIYSKWIDENIADNEWRDFKRPE